MEDWLKAYYMEMDPLKRQQLLLENTKETKDGQDGLLRQLWEARYGKGKPRKDDFVGYLMNLRYIAESGKMDPGGRKKKLAVNAILGLGLYEFTQKTENEQTVILSELEITCRKYIDISSQGRGFTSVIFGMGQLSDESIAGKIADEISRFAFDAPYILRMTREFEPLQRAAAEVFREVYPNREHYLRKR